MAGPQAAIDSLYYFQRAGEACERLGGNVVDSDKDSAGCKCGLITVHRIDRFFNCDKYVVYQKWLLVGLVVLGIVGVILIARRMKR